MIQNITLVLCLESINMWIDMDNKIIFYKCKNSDKENIYNKIIFHRWKYYFSGVETDE